MIDPMANVPNVPVNEDAGFEARPATGAGATTDAVPVLEAQLESQKAAQEAGAPTLASLFGDKGIRHGLGLFDDAPALSAIEAALFSKNGKPYVK